MTQRNRRKGHATPRRERQISVRTVRRTHPDLRKLSRVILRYSAEQAAAEAAAQADHEGRVQVAPEPNRD